ncbi:MAG: hypothetical protein KZQ94_15935 [Candidatus Thiodiazotropha sp. (ex Troendleina suluensis)]|nr:hypothetical protein [Candidatus Thiodiazotropha sp. (ex Troendleina suluensis)]
MATIEEFRNKVLRKLKVLSMGQTAKPEDARIVETKYDELYEKLTIDRKINYADKTNIPSEVVTDLVLIVAGHLLDEFQLPSIEAREIKAEMPEALRELRKQVVPKYQHSESIKATYY